MLNHNLVQDAFRDALEGLSVCTTGSTTLARTATGYIRASGSFVTDGFFAGMEILEAGFPTNAYRVVKLVEALTLTVDTDEGLLAAESAASGRTITCALPESVGWEDTEVDRAPANRCFASDELVPATTNVRTLPVSGGLMDHTGLYIVRWHGVPGYGRAAISRCADAVLALYPPGAFATLSDGVALRIRETPAPSRGQLLRLETGGVFTTITIPYRAEARNS